MIYFITVICASWHGNDAKWLRRTRDTLRPISRAQSPPKTRHRAQKFDLILLGRNATYFSRSATNISSFADRFCVLRHHRDQPNSECRTGIALRPRSLFQVLQWCRIATNVPDCAYHVPNTCPLRIFGSNLAIGCKIKGQDDSIG